MKKILVAAIAALGMISATVTFADMLNGAAGKKAVAAAEKKATAKLYPVDVLVLNRLDYSIRVQNGANVYRLASGDALRLPSNNPGAVPLYIVRDFDNLVFLNSSVCNRAVLTLKVNPVNNVPTTFIDGSQCYK